MLIKLIVIKTDLIVDVEAVWSILQRECRQYFRNLMFRCYTLWECMDWSIENACAPSVLCTQWHCAMKNQSLTSFAGNVTFAFWQLMSKSLLLFLIWMLGSLIHLLHFGWWMQGLWPLQGCLINELEILPEDAPTTSTCSEKHIPTTYKKRFFLILSFPE